MRPLSLFEVRSSLPQVLGPGAVVLRELASARDIALLQAVETLALRAPFRHMKTPGGFTMSVAMTNCGAAGWLSDLSGYRYDDIDPLSGDHWPAIPKIFLDLAREAAGLAGYPEFEPDACLVNRYEPGAHMSLHQDKNESDLGAPIVSVSLGLPAIFLFGGSRRAEKPQPVHLLHGDVVVWGGPARLRYHGVRPLKEGRHPLLGRQRLNLTFRKAL